MISVINLVNYGKIIAHLAEGNMKNAVNCMSFELSDNFRILESSCSDPEESEEKEIRLAISNITEFVKNNVDKIVEL